jgi:DNA-nicking Smr family endonuclease
VPPPLPPPPSAAPAPRPLDRHGLDAGWDKRLAKGMVAPDFSLDLHGFTLDEAHARLDHGLTPPASSRRDWCC